MITTNEKKLHIRWMIRRDMVDVLQIEQASFAFPWTEGEYLTTLRRNCIGMVAEQDPDGAANVVGYMIYELHKSKLHIITFAVSPGWRRAGSVLLRDHASFEGDGWRKVRGGVGSAMVAKLASKLSSHRRTKITLEVRETNLDAQLFFRAQGFKATRVLRGYYEDSKEDAYMMEYRLANATDLEEEPVPFQGEDEDLMGC